MGDMTWLYVVFGIFAFIVILYILSVAIDMELWYRDVKKGRR
jgi:hypothetical protein